MSYTLMIWYKRNTEPDVREADNIEEARNKAQAVVVQAMEAFGEDRRALRDYGYIAAEEQAIDMSEDGGVVYLWATGTKIEVINNDDKE